MAITNTDQGTLNRLLAALVIPNFPALNVTASYLGKGSISLSIEGQATTFIPTMTGGVTSPEPYQAAMITVHLLKSQALSAAYKAKLEVSSLLGEITAYPDATTLSVYQLVNCALMGLREMVFDGTDAGYVVTIQGFYIVNSSLYQ